MTIIEEKIEALKKELQQAEKYLLPLEEAGFIGCITSNRIISVAAAFTDIPTILKVLPAEAINKELLFAGKRNLKTESSFILCAENSDRTTPTFKLKYTFENGMEVQIRFPMDTGNPSVSKREIVQSRIVNNAQVSRVVGYNYYINIGTQQRYYGGSGQSNDYEEICSYAANEEEAAAIVDFLLSANPT